MTVSFSGNTDADIVEQLKKRLALIQVAIALAAWDARICHPFKIPESDQLGWLVGLNELIEVDGSILLVQGHVRVQFAVSHHDLERWLREAERKRDNYPRDEE